MDDLLKDAIADAKAVRETALENAKIALEEAFTPRLQSMLSKKIQSEMDHEDEEEKEEGMHDEDEEMDESDELDLEAVLRELETEFNEGEDEDEDKMDEGEHEDDEEKDEVKENDVSSGIGKSDNAHDKKSGDSTDIGKAGKSKHESVESVSEGEN